MIRYPRMLVILTILSLILVPSALTQQTFDLRGTVKGPRGEIRQFVNVSLEGPRRYSAMTDANGNFTMTKVLPGKYTIRVRKGNLVSVFNTKDVNNTKLEIEIPW